MTFTPLESLLMVAAASLVVGLAVHAITGRVHVSQAQCDERRRGVCDDLEALKSDHASDREVQARKTAILFRMMRAMIVHNKDMPAEVKERVLNETPGGGD